MVELYNFFYQTLGLSELVSWIAFLALIALIAVLIAMLIHKIFGN